MSITHWLDQVGHCCSHTYLGLTSITGDDYTKTLHSDTYEAIDSSHANLHGKNVFICGASKGIGRSVSFSFAKAGASCIAIGARSDTAGLEKDIKDAAVAAKKSPPRVLQIKLDVTDQESSESAAASIENQFGRLDILIYNAGVFGTPGPIVDSDPKIWWRTWDVNVRGAYLVTRACLPLMLRGGDKQIVNVSSVGAHLIGPGMSAYQTSKLALLRLTEFLISEYGEEGLLAFCIHPGNIVSPSHRAITRVPVLRNRVPVHHIMYHAITRGPVLHTVTLLGFLSFISCHYSGSCPSYCPITWAPVLLPSYFRLRLESRDMLDEQIHLAPLSTRNISHFIQG